MHSCQDQKFGSLSISVDRINPGENDVAVGNRLNVSCVFEVIPERYVNRGVCRCARKILEGLGKRRI